MANSRKDRRGYVLRTGESQRKDGRYCYSYTDRNHERHSVYAKTLAELRQKERPIIRAMEDGLKPGQAERMSVNDLFDRYIAQKYDLRDTTKSNYIYMYDHFVRSGFGHRKITTIRYSDVKEFYYSLILEEEIQANTLDTIHTVLHPAFQMAVRDDLLRRNPTDGVMAEIKKSHIWPSNTRRALTVSQQKAFMDYMRSHREYKGWEPVITVLLGTGMRIGECLGLRWDDLDFENRTISVNHNLQHYVGQDGKMVWHINEPKTASGVRTIPMIDEVFDAFLLEYELQKCLGFSSGTLDGYANFIFIKTDGNIYSPVAVNKAIRGITDAYNAEEAALAKKEHRSPRLLPHISAHILRHTFCTRLCENETNLKVIQSVMGHADITTTMDIYAEATEEKKKEVMANLQGKIII